MRSRSKTKSIRPTAKRGDVSVQKRIESSDFNNELELADQLARLRSLIEQSEVEEARVLVKELEARWPNSEHVRHWARVLAPPTVAVRREEQSKPLDRERAWLREHAGEYPGCWLAIYEDRLIAAKPDLQSVLMEVRRAIGDEGALLHFEPDSVSRD